MKQDEIIDMAIQAEINLYVHDLTEKRYIEVIEAFAKLVEERTAAKEREACALIGDGYHDEEANCGDLIRARGEAS